MSRSVLSLFVLTLLAFSGLPAGASHASEFGKGINVPSNLGFSTNVSDDGLTATIIFDSLYVQVGAATKGATSTHNQTAITTKVATLHIPYKTDQRSVTMTIDLRGFADIDSAASARLVACVGDKTEIVDLSSDQAKKVELKGKCKCAMAQQHPHAQFGDWQDRIQFTVHTHAAKSMLQVTLFLLVEHDTDVADAGAALLVVDSLDLEIEGPKEKHGTSELECMPPGEAAQIENIMRLTIEQLKQRYADKAAVRRGVHPKDHGCVAAEFKVHAILPADLQVGVFAVPGCEYDALIRFSNASVRDEDDSPLDQKTGARKHGSRGMAIKLLGVVGTPLVASYESLTQDFLMINQPVFTFSNVEDYEALSQVLLKDNDVPQRFFTERIRRMPDGTFATDARTVRARKTLSIVQRIQSTVLTAPAGAPSTPTAYQPPPASPVDNRYFSAAPFLFGKDHVMKFSANPVAPVLDEAPEMAERDYLRKALRKRLTQDIVFDFQVQVRPASDLASKVETEIEDACFEWEEQKYPFVSVATITIPAQDFETDERRALCENLTFTPWHGIVEHRPLGGINRLRLAVYEASTRFRHTPKEPTQN